MTHRAEPASLRPSVLGAAAFSVVLIAAAWGLSASPTTPSVTTALRVTSDGAALAAMGLAGVPYLAAGHLRSVLAHRAARWLYGCCATWLVAEVARAWVDASEAAGVTPGGLSVTVFRVYVVDTEPGRAILVAMGAAVLACASALRGPSRVTVALVAVGVASRALSGHLSHAESGIAAVAVHAVAAGVWCGLLAGMIVTVRHRREWRQVLPRYSQVALGCVVVLLVSGTVAGLLAVGSVADLYATPRGRVLAAKMALTCVLLAFGWRNRRWWVPRARAESVSAGASTRRALWETAVMGGAVGAAAILATTA